MTGASGASDLSLHNPLISVVVATRNAADTIRRCIDSIVGQDYESWEIVVSDGNSTDGTIDKVKEYAASHRVIWQSSPDTGIAQAWNRALDMARGEWILFLGSDDRLHNNHVFARMGPFLLTAKPEYRVVYGQIQMLDAEGRYEGKWGEPWELARRSFTSVMSLPHPGCFHRRLLFHELGYFDESFHIAVDHEFLLRELPVHDALFVPGIIVTDMQTGGVSNTSWRVSLLEARRASRAHGFKYPGIPWLNMFCRCVLRSGVVALVGPAGWSKLRRLKTRALRRHDDEDAG
jgi:glycosyltransferase involved in cell wall biosynthesis